MERGAQVEITGLLQAWVSGDEEALDELTPLVYGELCEIARKHLCHERAGHTLETSALVHEAYFRLVDQNSAHWRSRTHFYSLGARMMRRILVDHARSRGYAKRGGQMDRVPLEEVQLAAGDRPEDLVALDEALRELALEHPQEAQVVELRYFGGMSGQEIARHLKISTASVTRRWRLARGWLFRRLERQDRDS